jgi:hypothetical protein
MSGSALERIAQEEAAAHADIVRARRRLAALAELRRELADAAPGLEPEALFARLRHDLALIEARSRVLHDAAVARDAACAARVEGDAEAAEAILEIARARAVEFAPEVPPAPVLHSVRERAERARRRLAPLVALANRPWDQVDAPRVTVRALLAASPATGPVDVAVVVLPVPFAVQADGAARGDDLCLRLACRLVAGVGRWLATLGASAAPVQVREVSGCLALQVWLADVPRRDEARSSLPAALTACVAEGRELAAASLAIEVEQVPASSLAVAPASGGPGGAARVGPLDPTRPGALLRPLSIDAVAARLEMHPFDVARVLSLRGPIAADASIEPGSVARLRADAGVECWWSGPPADPTPRGLARSVLAHMLDRRHIDPSATRADNLFRGLEAGARPILRAVVNELLQRGYLSSRMTPLGLYIAIARQSLVTVQSFVDDGRGLVGVGSGAEDVG